MCSAGRAGAAGRRLFGSGSFVSCAREYAQSTDFPVTLVQHEDPEGRCASQRSLEVLSQ